MISSARVLTSCILLRVILLSSSTASLELSLELSAHDFVQILVQMSILRLLLLATLLIASSILLLFFGFVRVHASRPAISGVDCLFIIGLRLLLDIVLKCVSLSVELNVVLPLGIV